MPTRSQTRSELSRISPGEQDGRRSVAVMERKVELGHGRVGVVSLNEPMLRYPDNPVLTAQHVNEVWTEPHRQVVTVHNAGVAVVGDETVMVFRSHLRCGVSVIGVARSADGITDWRVAPAPLLEPATPADTFASGVEESAMVRIESGGVEDPRINVVDGEYVITYSGYDAQVRNQVRVCLAVTDDFTRVVRHGPVLQQDMRNVVIFSERIGGRYFALFRPNDVLPGDTGGAYTQIRIGTAVDFRAGEWEIDDEPIMRTGWGPSAFSDKIGPGAPPVRTPAGWLNLFHGVRTTMDGNPYVLGVALHDLDDPRRVQMSSVPVLFPTRADCRVGESDYVHVPNVVFSCAMVPRTDGTLLVYYAGNDTVMNVAVTHEDVLVELCRRYGQNPLTGQLLYPT
ncbi:glycoside hydrolase family 130 protein [Actinoplanes lobatus]|uniref:glycoside hydrolase family 130 protein n=1 Tax=Actinoplanes lobatus TaxID=113568 RepID=UPI00165F9214|nr:glycosidase [Actinoplanes lobatus]